jgi:hypothetical protein
MMSLFREATTTPLSSVLLQTPLHKTAMQPLTQGDQPSPMAKKHPSQGSQRQSPRLKAKFSKEKSITKLAQDLVAKKCGVLSQEETLDDMTLQNYL